MAGTIAPFPKHCFLDNNGAPAVGHLLFVYLAGTSTKQNTWTDAALSALNTNPIVLDSSGRATIFLDALSYKFVLAPPTDTDPPTSALWTVDGVSAVPTAGANVDIPGTAGETMVVDDVVYCETGMGGTAGRWYLASNFTLAKSVDAPRLGIVLANGTAGSAITVRFEGRVTTVGAVTPGAIYYLSNTSGKLETPRPNLDTDFELAYPFAIADSASTIVFPLTQPPEWTKSALRTIGFSAGQGNTAGGADTDLTSYKTFIPAKYIEAAGGAVVIEGVLTVLNNGDAKTFKLKLGSSGTTVTLWSSSAGVANHVVPFRATLTRRSQTTGQIVCFMWAGAASGGAPSPYMVVAALGTIDWDTNQNIALYAAANTVSSVVLTDYAVSAVRTPKGGLV